MHLTKLHIIGKAVDCTFFSDGIRNICANLTGSWKFLFIVGQHFLGYSVYAAMIYILPVVFTFQARVRSNYVNYRQWICQWLMGEFTAWEKEASSAVYSVSMPKMADVWTHTKKYNGFHLRLSIFSIILSNHHNTWNLLKVSLLTNERTGGREEEEEKGEGEGELSSSFPVFSPTFSFFPFLPFLPHALSLSPLVCLLIQSETWSKSTQYLNSEWYLYFFSKKKRLLFFPVSRQSLL